MLIDGSPRTCITNSVTTKCKIPLKKIKFFSLHLNRLLCSFKVMFPEFFSIWIRCSSIRNLQVKFVSMYQITFNSLFERRMLIINYLDA